MGVKLKKMTFSSVLPKLGDFYDVLCKNRTRLKPWFWWATNKVTPNKFMFSLFIFLYLCETKGKEIVYKLKFKNLYNEQFLIYVDGVFSGMIGLDKIDSVKNNAELWGWIAGAHTSVETVDESVRIIEDYCIKDKNLTSLYARTQLLNRPVRIAAVRNGYKKKYIESDVRISKRNSGKADIITWEKQLVK